MQGSIAVMHCAISVIRALLQPGNKTTLVFKSASRTTSHLRTRAVRITTVACFSRASLTKRHDSQLMVRNFGAPKLLSG